jgi:hypothetical protein
MWQASDRLSISVQTGDARGDLRHERRGAMMPSCRSDSIACTSSRRRSCRRSRSLRPSRPRKALPRPKLHQRRQRRNLQKARSLHPARASRSRRTRANREPRAMKHQPSSQGSKRRPRAHPARVSPGLQCSRLNSRAKLLLSSLRLRRLRQRRLHRTQP